MSIYVSRKYSFVLQLIVSCQLFGQSENDSLKTINLNSQNQVNISNQNETKIIDEEQLSNDTLNNQKSKDGALNQEEKISLVKSIKNSQDSLDLNIDSTEVLSINENWIHRFKNRKTQIIIASVPVIWIFYKYFQKEDESRTLIGSPPNWPS